MLFRCWRMGCALARCTHGLKTGKRRPGVGRPLEGTPTDSALHHVCASRGWSLMTLEVLDLSSNVLSLVAVRRFVSPRIEDVRDQVLMPV